ncbi:AglZ/HisF2 family acetamidino modification protein [Gammaproteobacteria bacterium]|nr:AglZ/HisF2 family acetamidino modification protein [Gammaproteobacteria bacterium]
MLRTRIIPCLLVQNNRLVKTTQFKNPIYVGDPINSVRIFNEKSVDEILILDISASSGCNEPNYSLIELFAAESRMPVCYGGGVQSIDQIKKIIGMGIEKISISSAAIASRKFIYEASSAVGSQSIAVTMDVKDSHTSKATVWTHNATVRTHLDPISLALQIEAEGAGEIIVNSIDRDGMRNGYDYDFISAIQETVSIPVTGLGGAGSIEDLHALSKCNIHGVAAASIFIFKGKFNAVLLNYPDKELKKYICS